jgi:ureidoglycolate hydrolase
MPKLHEVRVEPLTAQAFAPYGRLIAARDGAPDYRGASGTQGWHVAFESGRPLLSVLRTPQLGLKFTKMERHLHISQAFVPLGGAAAALAVAAPTPNLPVRASKTSARSCSTARRATCCTSGPGTASTAFRSRRPTRRS